MTSALILPRSRKMGRMVLKAFWRMNTNRSSTPNKTKVMRGLAATRMQNATIAVTMPPTNSISPVPIRFRTPSTSVMMRETRTPVRLES